MSKPQWLCHCEEDVIQRSNLLENWGLLRPVGLAMTYCGLGFRHSQYRNNLKRVCVELSRVDLRGNRNISP